MAAVHLILAIFKIRPNPNPAIKMLGQAAAQNPSIHQILLTHLSLSLQNPVAESRQANRQTTCIPTAHIIVSVRETVTFTSKKVRPIYATCTACIAVQVRVIRNKPGTVAKRTVIASTTG